MSPWPRGDARAWLFFGFGYAGVYQRSTSRRGASRAARTFAVADAVVHGAGGGFFEVPFGLGASYKLRKPWELCAELGGRAGFGHTGSVYEAPGPRVTSRAGRDGTLPPAGIGPLRHRSDGRRPRRPLNRRDLRRLRSRSIADGPISLWAAPRPAKVLG